MLSLRFDLVSAPTGTVTFLFTDVEGSTRRWENDAASMSEALARHDELLKRAFDDHGGHVFATGGDGFAVAFSTADQAVAAARTARRALDAERMRSASFDITARMGLHTGVAEERDGDYFGPAVNRAARIMAAGHGGQILASDATIAMLRDTSDVIALGEHRLRDLLDAAHLHLIDGDPSDHPPLRTLDAHDHNLPVLRSSIFGIDDTVTDVHEALREHRTVTLTGIGGVGKTRLALEVATRAMGDHDLTRFVDLSRVSDGGEVAQALGNALGLEAADLDSIVGRLGVRPCLLVVDNCEHVVEGVSDLLEAVLPRCPDCSVLATSREPLGIDGEHVRPVRSLSARAAVDLFIDRALAARPDFELDDAHNTVDDICTQLDRIPLAIELAAARVTHMSTADIAARLDERFRLLSGGRRRARQRQQTLQATMDWSYDLLQPEEQELLRAVAVFTGGFDADAAAAVWERPLVDTLDVLGSLVERSLITADASSGVTRYGMLETVRLYAQDRLVAAGEAEARRALHAAHFEDVLTERALDDLVDDFFESPPAEQRILADLSNFVALLDWLDEQNDLTRLGALAPRVLLRISGWTWGDEADRYLGREDVAAALDGDARGPYWVASSFNSNVFGRFTDQLRFGERALETATGTVRVWALLALANAASIFDPERVDELVAEAEGALGEHSTAKLHAIQGRRIDALIMSGNFDTARDALERLWESLGTSGSGAPNGMSIDASELLYIELVTGRDDRALQLSGEAPELVGLSGRSECTAAVVAAKRGQQLESARLLVRAFDRFEEFSMRLRPHEFTIAAGLRAVYGGDPVRACRLLASVPIQVRSAAAYQLLVHARRLVRERLTREQVDAIRAEMATVDPVAVRRSELVRLRAEVEAAERPDRALLSKGAVGPGGIEPPTEGL